MGDGMGQWQPNGGNIDYGSIGINPAMPQGGGGMGSWLGQNWGGILGGLGGILGGIGQIDAGNQARAAGSAASDGMQGVLGNMYQGMNGISGNINGISSMLQNFQLPQSMIQMIINGQMSEGQQQLHGFESQAGGIPNMGNAAQDMMRTITQGGLQGTQQLGAMADQDRLQGLESAGQMQLGLGSLQNQEAQTALGPYEMAYQQANQNAQSAGNGWSSILQSLASMAPMLMAA